MLTNTIIIFSFICSLAVLYIFYCQRTIIEYYEPIDEPLLDNEITIITYNIQKFPWSMKTFNNINNLLNNYSIILLQECYDDTYSSLQTNFPSYYIYRSKLNNLSILGSGLAILSKFKITKFDFIPFKNYNMMTLDMLSQKGFIVCSINNIWIILFLRPIIYY